MDKTQRYLAKKPVPVKMIDSAAFRGKVASAENFSHRIYIGKNIYGDVQLQFRGGKFKAQELTYPDYVMPEVFSFLSDVRTAYQCQFNGDK